MQLYLKKIFLYIHKQLYYNIPKKIVYNGRSNNLKSTRVTDINF